MREDVLAGRHAEQREPAGGIAHARDGLQADVFRSADQIPRNDVVHRRADQPDRRRRWRCSVRRHEAAGHSNCRHRPHRDRDVRSLLAGCERNRRRRSSRRRGRKVGRRIHGHSTRRRRRRRSQHAIQRQQGGVAHLLRPWLPEQRHFADARKKEVAPQRGVRRPQERGRHSGLVGRHEHHVRPRHQLREPEHAAIVGRRGRLENGLHGAVARAPGDNVFDERPHGDADNRFAGFVYNRAGDDTVLPHPQRDVRGPLTLRKRQALVLAPCPALAVHPRRIAVPRRLQEVLARRQIREEEAAFAVGHHATSRRCRILEILRHRQYDDGLGYRIAGGGVHDLADDHPGAWARGSAGSRDDLRGTPNRQGEHDNERRDPGCLSEPDHCGSGYY